jgi:hypothetical protein
MEELAARLNDRFLLLTGGRRTALPRHQTLLATLDWSYELLAEPERVVLRRLAVFASAFSLEAAAPVVASPEITSSKVVEGLSNLVEKSLVAADLDATSARYRLLDTMRAYAPEKLAESGELDRIARRHAEYYCNVFEQAETEWNTRPSSEWLAEYGRQIDNLCAAIDWAFSAGGDASIGVALTTAAVPVWMQLSLLDECRGRVERALSAFAPGANRDARQEMKLYSAQGGALMYTRTVTDPEVGAAWTKALEIAERLDDIEYHLQALWGVRSFQMRSGQHRITCELAQRFCSLAAKRPNLKDRLIGERMMGESEYLVGNLSGARGHIERMLSRYDASNRSSHIVSVPIDQRARARALLARVLWLQGFPDQAMRTAESSIEEARETNHAISVCYDLALGACPVALLIGDLSAADHYAGMLLDCSTRHGLVLWQAWAVTIRVCSSSGVAISSAAHGCCAPAWTNLARPGSPYGSLPISAISQRSWAVPATSPADSAWLRRWPHGSSAPKKAGSLPTCCAAKANFFCGRARPRPR